ncbi:CRISPR-associated protein Cas5 [Dehalobacterium formicoaceticum]|uniref:CRISPR-associated protein Cas5 n=1 Tax=Dehalobacterium formicoaceticum TaxID=51515 RepID=A0ABT1Y1H1_9FIRM|nr:CRISPR-associated protein Cas5 [Dehalobacterium formicoaceticum]MCR6544712.1 CRISPR-associated protein Cas5 [Dehalobacterium formicoaceticum]
MKGLAFDVLGTVGHFRRPDTTATQMTYPFITPTAAKGLVGAILGIEDFVTDDRIGIGLLRPVRTVAQQMSMLGKDSGSTFNRPTTIELLVNPGYRIYYTGEEYTEQLFEFLTRERAIYTTYLGVAYALTKPMLYRVYPEVSYMVPEGKEIEPKTVVPTALIREIVLKADRYYCRAGGFMYKYKGRRTFEKSIDFLYEKDGKSIAFIPKKCEDDSPLDLSLAHFGEDLICLI